MTTGYQPDVQDKGNGKKVSRGGIEGVVKIVGSSPLAKEFIEVGKSFEEALGRCVIIDQNQQNLIILYKAQLDMFELWDEVRDLTNWLNASIAVGGFNRSLAAMVATNIYVPEGAGIKLSKESVKVLENFTKLRAQRNESKEKEEEAP